MKETREPGVMMMGPISARCLMVILALATWPGVSCSEITRDESGTYIVDRRGEKWDISQAVSAGFDPERFEFGLGRDAFSPLDDRLLLKPTGTTADSLRVLGVSGEDKSKAYSIARLSRHEVANSSIGPNPIAVGY